jgi:hypothetical protein
MVFPVATAKAVATGDYSADKRFRPRTVKAAESEDEPLKSGPAAVSACAVYTPSPSSLSVSVQEPVPFDVVTVT